MKPLHVLVLDRNSERRDELAALLRGADHQVVATADAYNAAESIGRAAFDALLIDLDLPDLDLTSLRRAIAPETSPDPESLEDAERRHLALVLRHTSGNKRKAAHLLGISRSTLLNKVRKYGLLAALAGLLLGGDTSLWAQAPGPIPGGRVTSGTLSFDGHATVGDFVGTTTTVSGQITGGDDISAVRGWVEAPVRTLTTGNSKRDKDLNKSMESDKYPNIRFELTGVTPKGGTADSLAATLHGALVIHGVKREVALPGRLHLRGSQARVQSDFPLNLKDYRIGGLSKLLGLLKMYEDIEVHVDVLFELGAEGGKAVLGGAPRSLNASAPVRF
jgi:polyisoprenoid-binding protein YceI/CheY-like chemotaxis protein